MADDMPGVLMAEDENGDIVRVDQARNAAADEELLAILAVVPENDEETPASTSDRAGVSASKLAAISGAFHRAMAAAMRRCREITRATERADWASVADEARHGVNLWLAGRVACRRLVAVLPDRSNYAESARRYLEDVYVIMTEALRDASWRDGASEITGVLAELRGVLRRAVGRPLNEN